MHWEPSYLIPMWMPDTNEEVEPCLDLFRKDMGRRMNRMFKRYGMMRSVPEMSSQSLTTRG